MKPETLQHIHSEAVRFVKSRQSPGMPFGNFNQCRNAFAVSDFSARCTGLELWKALDLPFQKDALEEAFRSLRAFQDQYSGLVCIPEWIQQETYRSFMHTWNGDSFFTRSAVCTLNAWETDPLDHPVAYLRRLKPAEIPQSVHWERGGHHPFSIGDIVVLIRHNQRLGIPSASRQLEVFLKEIEKRQDPETGLWLADDTKSSLTPSINLTFHTIKFSYNADRRPLPYEERIIDSCLHACRDREQYGWKTGYACNDLDLALVLYSALRHTDYRREEAAEWARDTLPMILDIQKPDGGFSFYHEKAMDRHFLLKVSPGHKEGDLWGTLMYLGTIWMMTRIAYPELPIPWNPSEVHRIVT
jgi:hypothetical protein